MEDLVEFAVEYGKKLKADYVEARIEEIEGRSIALKNGIPEGIGLKKEKGIGIRVLVDGGMGFSSTNILRRENIENTVEEAIKIARAASKVRREKIEFSSENFHEVSYEVMMKKDFRDVSNEEKMGYLNLIEKNIISSGINVPMRFMEYSEELRRKYFMNSEGARIESIIPRVSVMYNLVVYENGKTEQAPFIQFAYTSGLEKIEESKPWEKAVEDIKSLKNLILNGVNTPEDKVDVIISPEVAGIAVHESVGHPYESDRIMGREGAQAGESFVSPDMIGKRIGSDVVNVIEDPTIPSSYGFYLYDDEGVKARERYLIRNGIINELLLNREYAFKMGRNSNASARASSWEREPIVRMANTYLAPGDYKFEELLEDIKLGVYIKSFNEWNIDDRRFQQRYIGREAYIIRNGEIKEPVKRPILEITTEGLWSSVDAIGNYVEFYPGTCGKGEPMQGVPVWMGGAPARLKDIILRR